MPVARTSSFAGLFLALVTCNSGADPQPPQRCSCAANNEGILEMSVDCWCGPNCPSLSQYLAQICDDSKPHRPINEQQTYDDCHLTLLTTGPSLGPLTLLYDSVTGELVGGTAASDVADLTCPGTEEPGYDSVAAGVYKVPASCHLSATRHPCRPDAGNASEVGPTGDDASAPPSDASAE